MKKNILKISAMIVILALVGLMTPIPPDAQAGSLSAISDTMSRLKKGATVKSDHTINYTSSTAMSSGTIVIDFNTGGFASGSVDYTDIDLSYGANGTENDQTLAESAGEDIWGAAFATNDLTLTFPSSSGTTITAGWKVIIEIGENADSGDQQMSNPSTSGSKIITITAGSDSGKLAVGILDDDQVSVTATVDPTLTFALADITLSFGSFSTASLRYADDSTGDTSEPATDNTTKITVSTNAGSGVNISIQSDGDGSANAGLYKSAATAHLIAADSAYNVINGSAEKYGAYGTNESDLTIDTDFDETNSGASVITRTAQTFASSTGAVSSATANVVLVGRTIGSTPAGSYADTLTLISTGTF